MKGGRASKMIKKNLEILEAEDKKTTTGKAYVRFKTDEGWMSCFDAKSSEELKKLVGKSAFVEIKESGEFKNIKKFISSEGKEEVEEIKIGKNEVFPISMKVSYAKDCFCAIASRISQAEFDGMDENERLSLMDLSIKIIEKAIKAFK